MASSGVLAPLPKGPKEAPKVVVHPRPVRPPTKNPTGSFRDGFPEDLSPSPRIASVPPPQPSSPHKMPPVTRPLSGPPPTIAVPPPPPSSSSSGPAPNGLGVQIPSTRRTSNTQNINIPIPLPASGSVTPRKPAESSSSPKENVVPFPPSSASSNHSNGSGSTGPSSSTSSSGAPPPSSNSSNKDRDELLEALLKGDKFTKYDASEGKYKATTIFLAYKGPSPSEPRSHLLCWRNISSGSSSAEGEEVHRLSIQSIVEILLGKRTRAFMLASGSQPPDTSCFSLVSESQVLNLEAASKATRVKWCKGIHHIMLMTGRKYSTNNYTPPRRDKESQKRKAEGKDKEKSKRDKAEREDKEEGGDLFRQLGSLMSEGAIFIKYDLDPTSRRVTRSRVHVWLGSSRRQGGRDSPGRPDQRAPGTLYWCDSDEAAELGPDRSRAQIQTRSMPLDLITDIYHGKQTPAFTSSKEAEQEQTTRCFSFATNSQTLNLVADSPRQRDVWVKGIHMLLKGSGKQMRKAISPKLSEQLLLHQPTIRMMIKGCTFRQYKLFQLPQPDRDIKDHDTEPPLELRICDVFVFYKVQGEGQPGMLYWLETGDSTPDCMPLDRITDIYLGKRTRAFQHSGAKDAPPVCCFSFVSKTHLEEQEVNLETMTKAQRIYWLTGIQRLLEFYGNQAPPSKTEGDKPRGSPKASNRPIKEPTPALGSQAMPVRKLSAGSTPAPSSSTSSTVAPSSVAGPVSNGKPSAKKRPERPEQKTKIMGDGDKKTQVVGGMDPTLHEPSEEEPDIDQSPGAEDELSPTKGKRKGISDEDPQKVFSIMSKIGEGAYGSVFKARDNRSSTGELVAVKVLKLDRKNIKNLRQEIRVLQQCNSNYIVAYKGTFRQKNNVWICMEYCDSGSLSDMLEECRMTLTEEQVAAVMKMALQGLEYIHGIKKIHRDLKAANILVNTQGDCKLADFGVSAEMKNTLARRDTAIGTPHWMAPEVINSNMKYNTKADVWSLGITAYELAVGEPPHSNVNQMRAIFLIPTAPPPQLPHPERWSKKFRDFLNLCLQKNPDLRPDAATLLKEHPFITGAGGREVIADLVKECELKRAKKKRDNLKTLQERLQTQHGPAEEEAEGAAGTVLRRPTELGEGEPDFEPVRNRTKPIHGTQPVAQDDTDDMVEYPPAGEDEDLIQIMYS